MDSLKAVAEDRRTHSDAPGSRSQAAADAASAVASRVFVLAATNALSAVDPAFLQPGRASLSIVVWCACEWDSHLVVTCVHAVQVGSRTLSTSDCQTQLSDKRSLTSSGPRCRGVMTSTCRRWWTPQSVRTLRPSSRSAKQPRFRQCSAYQRLHRPRSRCDRVPSVLRVLTARSCVLCGLTRAHVRQRISMEDFVAALASGSFGFNARDASNDDSGGEDGNTEEDA